MDGQDLALPSTMVCRIRSAALISWALVSLALAPLAQAQKAADPAPLYTSPAFQHSLIHRVSKPVLTAGGRSLQGMKTPAAAMPLAVSSPVTTISTNLDYQPSEGISRTLRQQLANSAAKDDPEKASEIRTELSTDSIWKQFDRGLSSFGYSSRNLADVLTSYYVKSWEVVNKTPVPPPLFRAARDQLAESLRHSPEIIFMSDAEKQRASEALGILTTLLNASSTAMLSKNDQIGFLTMQVDVNQSLLEQGIDLKHLKLTRRGFVPI